MKLIRLFPSLMASAAVVMTFFIALTDAQAGASNKNGNPFSNGTFFPDNGTFNAIIRSTNNFMAVVTFSTTPTANTTNTNSSPTFANPTNSGVATIYAGGEQFTGPAYGLVSGSTISATYIGYYGYRESGAYLLTNTNVTGINSNGLVTNAAIQSLTESTLVTNTTNSALNLLTGTNVTNMTIATTNNGVLNSDTSTVLPYVPRVAINTNYTYATNVGYQVITNIYTNPAWLTNPATNKFVTNLVTNVVTNITTNTVYTYMTNVILNTNWTTVTNSTEVVQTNITALNTPVIVTNKTVQTLGTTVLLTNQTVTIFGVTNSVTNACSGAFTATLQNSYPNQIFNGTGYATVNNYGVNSTNAVATQITYSTTVVGSRVPGYQ
jgi:hypothetical protein